MSDHSIEVLIDEREDGTFWWQFPDADWVGPFPTQEAVLAAARKKIEEEYVLLAKQALGLK